MTTCREQEGKFLVLNKRPAWERGLPVNLQLSDGGIKIREEFEYTQASEMQLEELTGAMEVTDFAVGECNLLYVLDTTETLDEETQTRRFTHSISIYDSNQNSVERIHCLDPMFAHETGLAHAHRASMTYAPGTLYVADTAGEQKILALAEVNWQVRWTVGEFPEAADDALRLEKPFEPVDIVVDRQGNLFALDRNNLAILKFDPAGRLTGKFGEAELSNLNPSALAISRDGFIYVLDLAEARVLKFHAHDNGGVEDEELIRFQTLIDAGVLPADFVPTDITTDARGDLYVGHVQQATDGQRRDDDSFIRRFSPQGEYLGEVAAHAGPVEQIVIDEDNAIYLFSLKDGKQFVRIAPERKFQKLSGTSLVKGTFFSQSLDSIEPGTAWHKFILDARAPANTQIHVSYLISDTKRFKLQLTDEDTTDLDVHLEELKRDIEHHSGETLQEAIERHDQTLRILNENLDWSEPVVNSNDALLRRAEGRYLWLRIELIGSEAQSPEVRSVRLDFPRTSYLRYLPAVYQEDERSRDFLERFLSLFETFFSGLEYQIDNLARYFDADAATTSGEYMRWLAAWLSLAVDKSWDEPRLRALVKRAPQLFKKRGTREGLEEMIEIFTGERPLIVEHFQVKSMMRAAANAASNESAQLTNVVASRPPVKRERGALRSEEDEAVRARAELAAIQSMYERLYGTDPYCFCVLLKPFQVKTEEERKAVRRLLDAEKPAHTCAGLLVLQPWVQLDMHTYMGVNTYLSQPSARLDSGGTMPRDTVLSDIEEAGQLERQSRLNLDITLT
ncbi:MAG TPA: phage tail protein [Pyrinomonadaceae bacterium]|jgi:phage tail-like protein|nr:phage tail protein [Pyrinomonadaceae bacterium]